MVRFLVEPEEALVIAVVIWVNHYFDGLIVFGSFLFSDEVAISTGPNARRDGPTFATDSH
jgi:hypothetical protein